MLKGFSGAVVYADDFVMSFQYKSDAELVYELLKKRMKHFGLSLEEKKTRLIEFGRFAEANRAKRGESKPETFDFLGFTHYCSHGKNGKFRVKRKTSRKKFSHKSKEVHKLIGEMRTLPVRDTKGSDPGKKFAATGVESSPIKEESMIPCSERMSTWDFMISESIE